MQGEIKQNTREKFIGRQNEFFVKASRFNQERPIPLHFHEYYEIEIITEGAGVMTLNGVDIPFEKGMVFFILPNDFHKFTFSGGCKIYNISFCEDILFTQSSLKWCIEKTDNFLTVSKQQLNSITKLCDIIMELDEINEKSKRYLFKSVLELFPKMYSIEAVSNYFNIAVAFIESHFKENISSFDVANECRINEDYLNRIFKKEIAITATEYIRKKRLHYSSLLLDSTDLPIAEIAFNSGFQSIQTFNRLYKEYYGVSPTHYRKQKTE